MKRTKKLLSFFLAIVMVITAFAAVPFTTNAATTVNFTNTGYKLISGTTSNVDNRYGKDKIRGRIEVCNDGGDGSFCAGFWTFSMPTLPSNAVVDSASIAAEIPYVYTTNKGVKFYATNGDFTTTNSFTSTKTSETINYVVKSGNNRATDTYALFNGYTMKDLGTFSEKGKTNTRFTNTITDAVKYAVENKWTNFNIFAYQPTSGGGSGSNWSDASIKLPTISLTYSLKTYTVAELKTLMTQFENNGISYYNGTNLYDAYTAYVAASKVYDAAYYGGNTSVNISEAYANLKSAMDNIGTWNSGVTKVAAGTLSANSATYVDGTHYKNLLYSPNITDNGDSNTGKNNNRYYKSNQSVDLEIYYPKKTVMCYDGSGTPMFPVFVLGANTTNNSARRLYKLYPALESYTEGSQSSYGIESSQFACAWDHWYGRGGASYTSLDFFSPTNNSTTQKVQINSADNSTDYHGFDGPNTSFGIVTSYKYNQFSNVIKYTATPSSALEKTYINWFWATGGSGPDDKYVGKASNQLIYILNYKGIKDQIDAKSGLFANISNYKEDSGSKFSTALSGYDVLTSYDYKTIDYSGDLDTLKTNLDAAYTKIKNNEPAADNSKGYPAIRTAIDTPRQIPALVEVGDTSTHSVYELLSNDNEDGRFTTSSYRTFKEKYDKVKNFMSTVVDDGYTRQDFADVAATALNTAINSLQVVADFTTITANYTEASNILNTYDSSLYTTSTWNALVNAINNATFATYTDTQKKDTGRTSYQATIDSQAEALRTAIDNLARRANFTNYNKAFDVATNSATGYLIPYTTNSVSTLPTYAALQKYNGITVYNNQDDTPDTVQSEIDTAAKALVKANTDVYTNTVDQSDLTAFTDSLASYDKDVFDTKTVDAIKASANALYKVVNFNGTDYYSLNVTDQEDLDSKIRDYINSFNSSLDKYSVSVSSNVTVKVNGVTQSPNAETGKYEFVYGTRVEFSAPTADTAWYMNYTSESAKRTQQFQKYAQTYTATIIGNMEVDARTKTESTPYRVTVERNYGVDGMTNGMAFVDFTAGGDYTLPTMPNHPYYSFDGYYVGGKNLDGNTVNITGNTTVIAKYVKDGSDLTVNVNGTPSPYAYNSKVTISEPGAYAWVEKVNGTADTWRPFYIGSECTFRVTESIELKSVTKADFNSMFAGKEAFAPNTRQSGAIADPSTNKATINAQRVDYLPQGAQITEYGILVAKDARKDDFNLENTNENSIRAKSTKLISGNQFSIGLKNLANTNFTYRSYMIYQVPLTDESGNVTSWETKTVYSEIMTYSGATV